jgi:hypothetical protein
MEPTTQTPPPAPTETPPAASPAPAPGTPATPPAVTPPAGAAPASAPAAGGKSKMLLWAVLGLVVLVILAYFLVIKK